MHLKIMGKIILPTALSLILSLMILTLYSYKLQKSSIHELMELSAQEQLNEIETDLSNAEAQVAVLKASLNRNYIRIARSVGALIEEEPTILETARMKELAGIIGVDEIHVTDGEGVLAWGLGPSSSALISRAALSPPLSFRD